MNRIHPSIFILLSLLLVSCASKQPHHPNPMPDPQAYNAHFHDLDSDGDGQVTWTEFQSGFPHAEEIVFETVDLNQDGGLDHDEWHAFRAAHGLEHQ